VPGCVEPKTRQLIALAQDGEASALEQLCRVYGERVRRIVRLRLPRDLRPKLDSVDLVQDVLLGALGGLVDFTYRDEGDFLRWLARITENKIHDHMDKWLAEKRDIRRERPLGIGRSTAERGGGRAPGLVQTTTPSAILVRHEELDKLERALDELKPEYREVIVLTRIEECSYQEAASRLGSSPEAIRKLLCRAMAALARTYERM
jgi:RNA polymerase sigma-70 factor (ECF subfamily)